MSKQEHFCHKCLRPLPEDLDTCRVCLGLMPPKKTELVAAVKKHAEENYETGGWDYVVECYDDSDLEEIIEDATTADEAIRKVAFVCGLKEEQRFEAQALSGEYDYYGIEEGPDGNLRRKKE